MIRSFVFGLLVSSAAWGQNIFPQDGTQTLAHIQQKKGRVVVLNMWASWCLPCREEFPALMKTYNEYKGRGLDLVFVSFDFASEQKEAQKFLREQKVDFDSFIRDGKDGPYLKAFNTALKNLAGPQYSKLISESWSGAIPTTFIFDRQGKLTHYLPQELTYSELKKAIEPLIKKSR